MPFFEPWIEWPSVAAFISAHSWVWPLCETFHFFGIILLIGGVGMFDLRVLGMARGLPPETLKRFIPGGVYGFTLCVVTGLIFVTGMRANVPMSPYDVIRTDVWLQLKLAVHRARRPEPAGVLRDRHVAGGRRPAAWRRRAGACES